MKVGYVRVSSNEQTEALQIDALRTAGCERIYGDHGVSGAVRNRKGLDAVLAALREGDILTVWKVDRLGRTTLQLLTILDDLRARGIGFQAISQGIDTTTPLGRMVFGQLAVFAEFERELIRERTKEGMEAARRRGVRIGRPRKLSNDEAELAAARLARESLPLGELALELKVARSTLARALSKP